MPDLPEMDPETRSDLVDELTSHGVDPERADETVTRLWSVAHIMDDTDDWSGLPALFGLTGPGGEKVAD